MSASRVLGLIVVSAWLTAGCSSSKRIDVGGTCILNSDCNGSLVCTMGKCHDACHTTADCPNGESCVKTSDSVICQLAAEVVCGGTSICRGGLSCAPDQRCRTGCLSVANCTGEQVCVGSFCVDPHDPHLVNGQLSGTTNDAGADALSADAGTGADLLLAPTDSGSTDVGADAPLALPDAGSSDGGVDVPVGLPDAGIADTVEAGDGEAGDSGLGQDVVSAQKCQLNSECDSVHCVDGYCCDKPCSGTCEACNLAGLEGTCSPIPAGKDPAAECPDKGQCVSTCNGKRACSPVCGEVGAPCSSQLDCRIALCVDGYCCDQSCTVGCDACNVPGLEGTCSPVPAGQDPHGACDADAPSTCGFDGYCDGKSGCRRYGTSTACNDSETICTTKDHCDGQGVCVGGVNTADFTPCMLVTVPDYDYDICVHGKCVSPGTCSDATCNPPHFHVPLPDTNQRICQDAAGAMTSCPSVGQSSICATTDFCGQDAQYGWDASHPATARFARAGDWEPTVTDNVTGLMWQGCVPGLNGAACATGTALKHLYADGHDYCANSDWGGFNDWRLPDRFEIESIANYAGGDNAVRTDVFPALSGGLVSFLTLSMNSDGTRTCVTLTSGAEGCGSFCVVNHSAVSSVACGGIYANGVGAAYALCVRGALTPGSAARFSRTTGWEPVVSDADNGLMWQGCSAGQNGDNCENGAATTRNWHDALQYCEVLSWAGHDDWRLPNAIELLSISDGAFKSGAIDVQYFPKTDAGGAFCSSTPYGVGATVWIAEYGSGSVGPADKGSSFEVRCVRMLP